MDTSTTKQLDVIFFFRIFTCDRKNRKKKVSIVKRKENNYDDLYIYITICYCKSVPLNTNSG